MESDEKKQERTEKEDRTVRESRDWENSNWFRTWLELIRRPETYAN